MDRYDLAHEIAVCVRNNEIDPEEDLKFLAKTLDVLWDQTKVLEEIKIKSVIQKITSSSPPNTTLSSDKVSKIKV